MPSARPTSLPRSGPLMMIGGAEDKLEAKSVLSRFVRYAGGTEARIAIVATASSLGDQATELYRDLFSAMGVRDLRGPRPLTRKEAGDAALVAQLADATGVFMTGGNQGKLAGVVAGTRFGEEILAAHRRGAVIAGTSAGASVQSDHMVAFGAEGATPKLRMVTLAAGLGLIKGVIVDQHFDQRNRYGRLLALIAASPSLLGIGIDEDTAAIVTEERWLEVLGRGAVTVFDGSLAVTNLDRAKRTEPLLVSGVTVHSLPAGARFDLQDRILLPSAKIGYDTDPVTRIPAIPTTDQPAETSKDPGVRGLRRVSDRRISRLVAIEGANTSLLERNARRRAARKEATRDGREPRK